MQYPQARRRSPILSIFLTCIGLAGTLIIISIAVLPGPGPDPALTQVIVMHNSMIAGRKRLQPTEAERSTTARLEAQVDGVLEGQRVESWLYGLTRYSISVHQIHGRVRLPEHASPIPLQPVEMMAFEVTDLTFIAWRAPTRKDLTAVVGSAPLSKLMQVAERVMERGPGPDRLPLKDPANPKPELTPP